MSQENQQLSLTVNQIQKSIDQILFIESYDTKNKFMSEQLNIEQIIENSTQSFPNETKKRIYDEFLGLGPISSLIDDEEITEIIINGWDKLWFEKNGCLQPYDDAFLSEQTYNNFVHRMFKKCNIQTTINRPFVDGKWDRHRIHIVAHPVSEQGFQICFRKHPENTWTLSSLEQNNWASSDEVKQLKSLIQNKSNLLVIGPTGCGKTSVLNAFLNEIQSNERVIILEDTPELTVPNSVSSKLITRIDPGENLKTITLAHLVKQSLRMRPDRLVLGEIRGSEAKDLALALSTGHSGSWGTLHAQSAQQALIRLEMLIQLGAPHWSIEAIRSLIKLSIDYIIVLTKKDSVRLLEGIYQITSLERFGFCIEKCSHHVSS